MGDIVEIDGQKMKKLNEGKTKVIYEFMENPNEVLIYSKDRITAGDGARSNELEGKAAISNQTTSAVFDLLNKAGIKTHMVRGQGERAFVARKCDMLPIEFVARRLATGSFLKRHPGVPEGFKFYPLKQEFFYKDDANHDPQWSYEQVVCAAMKCGGRVIGGAEIDAIVRTAACVFEVLEHLWNKQECSLIDMKIEFGIDCQTQELLLADIIDSDSWRLWPKGDRALMKDKQVYREMAEVTADGLQAVKKNFQWVLDKIKEMQEWKSEGLVVVLLGSKSDMKSGEMVREVVGRVGVECHIRVTSAHKGPDLTLKVLAEYEALTRPVVVVAIAGRSNGLGPTVSGNTSRPVINCPPISPDWGAQDVWSSLRLPSGLSCSTVISPETAGFHAASILALSEVTVWCSWKAMQLKNWLGLVEADQEVIKTNVRA